MKLTIRPEVIEKLKAKDEILAKVIDRVPVPVRKRTPDLFEAIVKSIISQQISTKAAETISARLKSRVESITPEALLTLHVTDIQSMGMSFRKAGYIHGVAREVAEGRLDLDELSRLEDASLIKELTKLPGIGPWTAEMLLIFSLGRDDVLSITDLGIVRGIERVYGSDFVTPKNLSILKERFTPYGTAAGLYFWLVAGMEQARWKELASDSYDSVKLELTGLS